MNYKKLFFLLLGVILSGNISFGQSTFFIKYKTSVSKADVEKKVQQQSVFTNSSNTAMKQVASKVDYFAKGLGRNDENLSRIIKVKFASAVSYSEFAEMMKDDPEVDFIQGAHTYKIESTPNDSLVAKQWGLQKINAFGAWDITMGSNAVLVGIIDTGIDYLHPDLKNKIFINKGETGTDQNGKDKRSNGIDDDGDGFIDDYMGWDFVDRQGFPFDSLGGDYLSWDNNPMDENNHGTNIAGILGAETNNNIGISGVAPNLMMLNLRAFDTNGNGEEDDVAAAILYAVAMNVKVINMSFGDTQFSYILRDVIKYAYSRNVVLVASSGNDNSMLPHYPSGYSEVICVGNSMEDDVRSGDSNYGSTLDLVAPGSGIITTAFKKPYDVVYGTSAAAPFVSAAAGLILSVKNFTNEEVRQILKSTAADIDVQGWDIKTGAGRLDLYKALSVLAPGKIHLDSPVMDFATNSDSLVISGTVVSPYFQQFELQYGAGLTPTTWTSLVKSQSQVINSKLFVLNLKNLVDSSYTLRVMLTENNGNTRDERVNFHIIRKAPTVELINTNSLYYGNKSTLFAELVTDQKCITRMYYKKTTDTEFKFITLDGFSTNNQFVKNNHYGFVPKQLIDAGSAYEIYFEAENLAGLKTILKDNTQNYIRFTDPEFSLTTYYEMPFSLPKGTIFQDPVNFISNNYNEVLYNQYYEFTDTTKSFLSYNLVKFENNKFSKVTTDSLLNKIPRTVGDFNKDGKIDVLSTMVRYGYIDEQVQPNSFLLKNTLKEDSTSKFFPIFAKDIDGDGITDIVALQNDYAIGIYNWNNNVRTLKATLSDFSDADPYSKYPNVLMRNFVTADCNNDKVNELWFADRDGDIMSYNITAPGVFQEGHIIHTDFETNYNNIMSVGDFDGDGVSDIAVLLDANTSYAIAPYKALLIYNFKNDTLHVLYENFFLDQSTEFRSLAFNKSVNNAIRFVDIDNDKKEELVVSAFPYTYIIKNTATEDKVIFYKEGGNSYSIFAGDLNKNGVKEIALETAEGIKFYEFSSSTQPVTPSISEGYSISESSVYLKWNGDGSKYYIYRGTTADNTILIDSCSSTYYTDSIVKPNTDFYYKISSFNVLRQVKYSSISDAWKVHSHVPAKVLKAASNSLRTVQVFFSDRVNNTIENLRAFELIGIGYPSSISAASQYSYLLTFSKDLPAGARKLALFGLRDYFGSPIQIDTVSFFVDPGEPVTQFFISSYQIVDKFQIKVDFNLPVDETTALNLDNYTFKPENKISKVTLANNNSTLYLFLDGKKPVGSIGKEYRLKIDNLVSSAATGNVKINSETGSYLILTGNAKDLSDVFCYPNPAKVQNGQGKVTFANLPRRAKILILSLAGEQICSLTESDGDGGTDFNLRNKDGSLLGTGIYIYRVVMLDESGNEGETKIGKFAVIR